MPPLETWVLIVEDDAHHLIVVSSLLKELGIRYRRNTTGANVIEQLNEMIPRPSLLLLDLDLPDADAFAILETVRSDPYLVSLPIVALVDSALAVSAAEMQALGFAAVLFKPLPRREFIDVVTQLLGGGGGVCPRAERRRK